VKIINTWIGQYFNRYTQIINQGCSFENHFKLASDISNKIGFNPSIDAKFLPKINSELIPNVLEINKKIESFKNDFDRIKYDYTWLERLGQVKSAFSLKGIKSGITSIFRKFRSKIN
jgi:hypothetical protein